ncbi:DUF551 domain-containing protein [Citrobacter sp. Cpo090]|uniref:DUF551 domain-containing protein n=1 Tax=Citrobacter sp. Cpo090 TaxID=2985139 RepID=UPI0025787B4E|nr:DUF551 domain-containing protein [Citrobacter sp. Cpo090]MDM2843279.1 DUF551 domain-containing protein [Citrobacter sp. Cpo090]
MTTNHPAHGPVSLDRLHQIREILSKAAAQSDGGNLGYAMADAVKVIDGAIAAFGAEPVVVNDDMAYAFHHALSDSSLGDDEVEEIKTGLRAAFANVNAQPAPVVNTIDETLIEALRLVQCMLDDYRERNYGHAQEWIRYISAKMDDYSEQHGDDAYSVISAAMLQAGNFPVTPDGWIPVSERMPEGSEEVLCTKEFDGPGDWHKKVGYWLSGKWTVYGASWTPTHWMPLPASPQQEVK